MDIILKEQPKKPIIIQGLPSIGMVGAIAAEFLLKHLGARLIGKIIVERCPPLVAIHEGKLIEPFSIYYSKKYNIVVVHSIVSVPGSEWQLADAMASLANMLKASQIISLEGIGSSNPKKARKTFYYTRSAWFKKLVKKTKLEPLNEGIIIGHTPALLAKADITPVSCILAGTHSDLPDSKAAAEIIKALDSILALKINYAPLLKVASKFEKKIKGIMTQGEKAKNLQAKKQMNYVG